MADEGEELVLEDNIEPAAAMEDIYVEPWRQSTTPSIHVCVGGACSQDGSHATLAEIEDLVAASGGGCKVATDWCFGRCGAGPNVLVVNDGNDRFLTGMRSLDDSITAVKLAMGRGPTVAVELEAKLKQARRVHALEQDLSRAEMMVHCSACTSDDATFDRHLANALEPGVSTRWVSMRFLKQSRSHECRSGSDHSRKPRERVGAGGSACRRLIMIVA